MPNDPQIFKATYSGVPVYEMICKNVAVMRRRSDSWLNATQILKVAGFDKPQRTRVLEREVQKGTHEKVQGGYGKYQGTWVPLDRGLALARQYNVEHLLRPIIDFQPTTSSPPLAPKHITAPPARPKRSGPIDVAHGRRGSDVGTNDSFSRASSPHGSGDGSMTASPSEVSSSSRTPSPIGSTPNLSDYDSDQSMESPDLLSKRSRRSRNNWVPPASLPARQREGSGEKTEADKYADAILEYFISDTNQIPNILVNPPPDFNPDVEIDDDGHAPLHWACAMGRVRIVKLLITAGADIFKVNKAGQTALMRSVMFANNYDVRKFPELYELLHRSTLNIDHSNKTVFHHIVDVALSKGKTHAARYYIETILNRLSDFPHELADIINFQDEDGETALSMAARCRSKRLVKLLIDHGADPKLANREGKTTEDYILEDERFRASPIPRGPAMAGRLGNLAAHGPRLHQSAAALRASGKCTNDMATLLDSLATSFDTELTEKERDLTQAHQLFTNIQAEIAESQRAVQGLKNQAAGLEEAKERLAKLEEELLVKMGRRYRLGWEKWVKDEETREKHWLAGTAPPPPTQNGNGDVPIALASVGPDDTSDLAELHKIEAKTDEELHDACEALRKQTAEFRERRKQAFADFVKFQAEAGTGGRMGEYRRLIGAGCGGLPPNEVDNYIGLLLENLESEEPTPPAAWGGTGARTAALSSTPTVPVK